MDIFNYFAHLFLDVLIKRTHKAYDATLERFFLREYVQIIISILSSKYNSCIFIGHQRFMQWQNLIRQHVAIYHHHLNHSVNRFCKLVENSIQTVCISYCFYHTKKTSSHFS